MFVMIELIEASHTISFFPTFHTSLDRSLCSRTDCCEPSNRSGVAMSVLVNLQRRIVCGIAVLGFSQILAFAELKGTWTDGDAKKSLSNAHYLGAATLLSNGNVIAAGGLDWWYLGFTVNATAETYDPMKQHWTSVGRLNSPRWSLDAVALNNGKALFAGGASAFAKNATLDSAEIFDPKNGTFTYTVNKLSVARHAFGLTLLNNGKVLLTGGHTNGASLGGDGVTAVDVYDPLTNSFQVVASMKNGRSLHAQLTLADGRVVVVGGARRDAEIYDPVQNSWTPSANQMSNTLKDMKAFEVFDGRVFIASGQMTHNAATTDATWFFDPTTRKFTEGPSMAGFNYAPSGLQVGCSDYSAFDLFPAGHPLHGRYFFYAGGEHDPVVGADVPLHSSSIFDVARNKFVDMGPMPFVHDDHTESLLRINQAGNPEVLLFGGNRTSGTSRFEFNVMSIPKP